MPHLGDIKLFLLDMDGTFYLGDTLLPGAAAFIALCRERRIAFSFLTNNSSKSAADYLHKLARLGIAAAPGEMLTSGDATLSHLQRHGFAKELLVVGTQSLQAQFAAAGYEPWARHPTAVVLGFDTGLTYAKLTALCDAVRAGLPYIATHPDRNCPVPGGMIPDIGATIAYVQAATGRLPDAVIGKPNRGIAEAAAARAGGLPLDALCMVGDRLYTDIALGETGVHTALVLCGETTPEMLAQSPLKPTWVFADLRSLVDALEANLPPQA